MLLDINEPYIPRRKRPTARFEHYEGSAGHHDDSPEVTYRKEYYDVLDNATMAIKERFDQEGTKLYSSLVKMVQDSIDGKPVSTDPGLAIYDDIDWDRVKCELQLVSELLRVGTNTTISTIAQFAAWLQKSPGRSFLTNVELVITLILTLPATNASSERVFSTLKRIKTYLRSTMTQQRLNSTLLVHTYKDLTDSLNVEEIISLFVANHIDRKKRIAVKIKT